MWDRICILHLAGFAFDPQWNWGQHKLAVPSYNPRLWDKFLQPRLWDKLEGAATWDKNAGKGIFVRWRVQKVLAAF